MVGLCVVGTLIYFIRTALVTLLLAMCLWGYVLRRQSGIYCECEAAMLSLQWMLLVCLAVWCGCFLFLTFGLGDLPLIGLLLVAITAFFMASGPAPDAITLLAGVTLGRFAFVLLRFDEEGNSSESWSSEFGVRSFLIGLVLLLAFSSWWHLNVANYFYQGLRWTGLWENPNIYGMLMGAGLVLTIGLLTQNLKAEIEKKAETGNPKPESNQKVEPAFTLDQRDKSGKQKRDESADGQDWRRLFSVFFLRKSAKSTDTDRFRNSRRLSLRVLLFIAAGMMGVGVVMSYSRGAWIGTVIGLLYLAKAHGKFKWRFVLPGMLVVAMVVFFFWHSTADDGAWYLKRMDLSRASAQHRVAAWKAGFEMMRDHPFGVGWNKAVETYNKNYSPPEGGAPAITTNDYLMLGTQLGWPGLVCFVVYVGLCLRGRARHFRLHQISSGQAVRADGGQGTARPALDLGLQTLDATQFACRAGALSMLVAFWFDGGLFKLATAAVFWILLELGSERQKLKTEMLNAESGRRFRHLTPALSPDGAEREPKSGSGNPPSLRFGAANRKAAIDHGLITSVASR